MRPSAAFSMIKTSLPTAPRPVGTGFVGVEKRQRVHPVVTVAAGIIDSHEFADDDKPAIGQKNEIIINDVRADASLYGRNAG